MSYLSWAYYNYLLNQYRQHLRQFMERFNTAFLHVPPFEELVFDQASPGYDWWRGRRCDLQFQHQILTTVVSPELPLLRLMCFTEEVYWKMEDVNAVRWRPVVYMQFHERVRRMVKRGKEHITDFDGVLSSLFETYEMTDAVRRTLKIPPMS
jgi:hypothetical protein